MEKKTSALFSPQSGVRGARCLSSFELLPVEIIQKIFFYSLEVNLPRASPALARCLSAESIYRIFLLYSFFDENKEARIPGKPIGSTITKAFRPAEYRTLNPHEKIVLQLAVFNCRWCTYARVKACLPKLMKLTVQSVWTDNGVKMEKEERLRLENFNYEELDQGRATSDDIKPFRGTDERDDQEMTLEIFSTFAVDIIKENEVFGDEGCRDASFHPVTCFGYPPKLLNEPWTWENIQFFHLIRKHNVRSSLLLPDLTPQLQEGINIRHGIQRAINDAIKNADLDFLHALLIMDKIFWDFNFLNSKSDKSTGYTQTVYRISEDHFKVAVSHPEKAPHILRALIRHENLSLPWWNDDLRAWTAKQNNSFGKRMLVLMDKLERGEKRIGRDIAMLMLDRHASNAQPFLTARLEKNRSALAEEVM
jgi:hypothetical protein